MTYLLVENHRACQNWSIDWVHREANRLTDCLPKKSLALDTSFVVVVSKEDVVPSVWAIVLVCKLCFEPFLARIQLT